MSQTLNLPQICQNQLIDIRRRRHRLLVCQPIFVDIE